MTGETDNTYNKQIIIVDDDCEVASTQSVGEVPTITIEEGPVQMIAASKELPHHPQRQSRWLWFAAGLVLSTVACIIAMAGWRYYRTYINIGISVSVKSEENIAKLSATAKRTNPEVVMTSDSILGVALNFYELRGLRAEVTLQEPDTTDTSVYLYSRCADHEKDGTYIGSLVMNGKVMQIDRSRLGYCAMANDNVVIGIARDERVKDYVVEQGGSFFRQFILVSNGVIPFQFHLHGKVERRGMGRIADRLYYIETRHAETMWDFADALREYGFTDAIYITGGTDYSFYRTADGTRHDIGDVTKYPHRKWQGVIPWVVFRKN